MANHMDICRECRGIFDGDEPCDECQFQAAKARIASLEAEIAHLRQRESFAMGSVALDKIESLEAALEAERTEHDAALAELTRSHTVVELEAQAEIERLEADLEAERGRAARAEERSREADTVGAEEASRADMLLAKLNDAEIALAAARADAVKAFAEWLDASGPKWFEAYTDVVTGGEITMSFPEAAARFLARKEPTDG